MDGQPLVNFINILRETFTHADPKSAKKYIKAVVLFALLGSGQVKASSKMLMKLTPLVNFINILWTAFALIF